jgi:phage terminase Nu1 subunit (DNA packaging protein)
MASDDSVSAGVLADWLACTVKSVAELAARGVIERTGRGRYPLKPSVRRYAEHMRRVMTGRGEGTASEARGRLARAQAALAVLKARRLAGALVAAADVQSQWVSVMFSVRARLLAVPSRVQQFAPHLTQGDIEAIDREIREALSALADGDGKSSETDGFSAMTDEAANPPS